MPQDKKDCFGTWDSRETEFITHKQTNTKAPDYQSLRNIGPNQGKTMQKFTFGCERGQQGALFSRYLRGCCSYNRNPSISVCVCTAVAVRLQHTAQEAARTTGKVRWMHREAQEPPPPPPTHTCVSSLGNLERRWQCVNLVMCFCKNKLFLCTVSGPQVV